jgi:hypothetical protein
MPNLQKKIASQFIDALSQDDSFREDQVKQIEEIVTSEKKPKADEFWQLFCAPSEDEVL